MLFLIKAAIKKQLDQIVKSLALFNLYPVPALAEDVHLGVGQVLDHVFRSRQRDKKVFSCMGSQDGIGYFLQFLRRQHKGIDMRLRIPRKHRLAGGSGRQAGRIG